MMATVNPPCTTRSATFSPTGPAPMTMTSYVALCMSVSMSVSLRRATETDGRDEEEDGAGDGVGDRAGQRRMVGGGGSDEHPAGEYRDATADDHRPLAGHLAASYSDDELDQPGHDRPGTPHTQDRRDAGGSGKGQADRGQHADRDVHVQQDGHSGARRAGVDDGGSHIEQWVQHEKRGGERPEVPGGRERHQGPGNREHEADEVQLPQSGRRRREAG